MWQCRTGSFGHAVCRNKQEGKKMKDSKVLKEELLQGKYESLFRDIYQAENEAKRQNARYA